MSSSLPTSTRSSASFRDPAGRLLHLEGRLLRRVSSEAAADLEAFLASATAAQFQAAGNLVTSRRVDPVESRALLAKMSGEESGRWDEGAVLVEHERIPFASFPYEWPPEMLHAAAALTLDLAESLLPEGLGLKDATPYNILFRGPQPVFVDVLSFERRDPGDPTWLPYAQFLRTFLLPLLVNKHFGLPLAKILTTSRDGLESDEVYRLCGFWQRLRPPFLSLATLPTWLAARHDPDDASLYRPKRLGNPEKARFVLGCVLRGLRRQLRRVAPAEGSRSAWSDYAATHSYTEAGLAGKRSFVEGALEEFRPRRLLDVGCNIGQFSLLAARAGAQVVAIDADPAVVGEVWRQARAESLDVLPLVVNLARPSPALGWRNRECPAFLDRARGGFDAVLMLALVHHLLVSERVPLEEIIDLAAELTTDLLVIEYVDPADSMFRRITRGRDHLHADLNREGFEAACRRRFRLVRSQRVSDAQRWLYLFRKNQGHAQA